MRCKKCGAEVPSGFKFCNMCGAPIAMTPVAGIVAPSSRHTVTQNKWLVTVGLLLVVVLIVACTAAMLLVAFLNAATSNKNLDAANTPPITSTMIEFVPPPSWTPTIELRPTLTLLPIRTPTIVPRPSSTRLPTQLPTRASGPLAKITVDNWEIAVTKVTFVDKLSAAGVVEKAHGRFANIFMTVTNRGYSQDTFVAYGILVVKDAGGVVSEENSVASFLAELQFKTDIGASINPDASANVVAVFDISTSSAYYMLSQGSLAKRSSGNVTLPIK